MRDDIKFSLIIRLRHDLLGFIDCFCDSSAVDIRREGGETFRREPVTQIFKDRVQAPPGVQDNDTRRIGLCGAGYIACSSLTIDVKGNILSIHEAFSVLNFSAPLRVKAASSANKAGSTFLKLKHDFPCMRFLNSGEISCRRSAYM